MKAATDRVPVTEPWGKSVKTLADQQLSMWNALAGLCAVAGIAVHLWAGWSDEGRIRFIPAGHAFVLAMFSWLLVALVSGIVLLVTRGRARIAWISLVLSFIGLALFWIPFIAGN